MFGMSRPTGRGTTHKSTRRSAVPSSAKKSARTYIDMDVREVETEAGHAVDGREANQGKQLTRSQSANT
eukprot:scaffold407833_cov33-Prasinocladus_malaysianus.AAC.1